MSYVEPGIDYINHKGVQYMANARFAFYGGGMKPNQASSGKRVIECWKEEFHLPNRSNSITDTINNGVQHTADRALALTVHGRRFIITNQGETYFLPKCFSFTQDVEKIVLTMSTTDEMFPQPFGQAAFAVQFKHFLKKILGFAHIVSMNESAPFAIFEINANQEPNTALTEWLFNGGNEARDIWLNYSECSTFDVALGS